MNTKAGEGEHRVYRISEGEPDGETLERGVHYLRIEAVAWFINRSSSWFTDRMASGTLTIQLGTGQEEYQAALGTFELDGGARFAPVFQNPVLPQRNYRGGDIILNASLSGVKKDTVLSSMLKSAADASLGIVAGMIETATVAGPQKILGAAGGALVNSVKNVLQNEAEKREAMFDFSGLQYGVRPDELNTPRSYLLMHRGADLDETRLSISDHGALLLPFYRGAPLVDGAWLLLSLSRSEEYRGAREWFKRQSLFRKRVNDLMQEVDLGGIDRDRALAELLPSGRGDSTIYDEYVRLRTIINNDGVITDKQAGVFKGQLTKTLKDARASIESDAPEEYGARMRELRAALSDGAIPGDLREIVSDEIALVSLERQGPNISEGALDLDHLVSKMPRTFDMGLADL